MACEDTDAIIKALITAATGPSMIQTDAATIKQHGLTDLIAIANYLSGSCAGNTPGRGLRFNRLIPDGTVQGFRGRRFR